VFLDKKNLNWLKKIKEGIQCKKKKIKRSKLFLGCLVTKFFIFFEDEAIKNIKFFFYL
jgi:hypothetical protein